MSPQVTGDGKNTNIYKVMEGERFPTALMLFHEWSPVRTGTLNQQTISPPPGKFLDEIAMLKFMQAVMRKPGWQLKLDVPEIVNKWKDEAAEQGLRKELFNYALSELEYLRGMKDQESGIERSGVDLVWKSDTIVHDDLHKRFLKGVAWFDFNASKEKDWHPGSNEQVLDLVHPSLFCLVYKQTKDLNGVTIDPPKDHPGRTGEGDMETAKFWSEHYQWLPAEFLVDEGGLVEIGSYINSLHPDSGLYPLIAELFSKAVPLFERVLSDLRANLNYCRFHIPEDYYWWKEEDRNGPPQAIWEKIEANPDQEDDIISEWETNKEIIPLPIPEFKPGFATNLINHTVKLNACRLQVILKIGSIELTPEKPNFKGGNWHVEGMANEKIVATAIYYFNSRNIVGDELQFRQSVEMDMMIFDQNDDEGAGTMFGISRDDPQVQEAGGVPTPERRFLCFPNIYQHMVPPFSLADRTQPGHRKILVFFLVDPTQRIPSTADVPPQDARWQYSAANSVLETGNAPALPQELKDLITSHLGDMTLEEAKDHRLKLMEERSTGQHIVDSLIFQIPFDLCEH